MEEDRVPLAALNHYGYCPHRCWRMFCLGEFSDNAYTLEGSLLHERVHTTGESWRGDVQQVRNLWLYSDHYRLVGRADLVEQVEGHWYPVEYKRDHHGQGNNDALQLCGQVLCLEEMTGERIEAGFIYNGKTHQRQQIPITEALRAQTLAVIEAVRALLLGGEGPPAIYGSYCRGCSLYRACLPEATSKILKYREGE